MNFKFISNALSSSFVAATLLLILVLGSFLMLEPTVGRAISDVHKITQNVTAEISFLAIPNDVVMSPSLAGITGGRSAGTSTVRVLTNNTLGYTMTLAFSTTTAMTRNGGGGRISNYNPTTPNIPDFAFSSEVFGQFAYTVIASTSADLDTHFKDNASACNLGSNNTASTCWLNPSTTAQTIINRTTATLGSGATTSLAFRVDIPSNPSPAIQQGTYVATATLTAITN